MSNQSFLTPELLSYVRDVSLREDDVLRGLRELTAELPMGQAMQVMAEEGQLLGLLVGLVGASEVLEIGTFTGYSTLCMARELPENGRLVTCDISEKWPDIARKYWSRAGMSGRVEVRIGTATDTLSALLAERGPHCFDLAFIDADKANYPKYYELTLELVRPGGLIVLDNTLFFGQVIDPAAQDADTIAIREVNESIRTDERVRVSLLPMADGITLVHKKPS